MPAKNTFDLNGHLKRVLEDTAYSVDFGTFKLALYFYDEFEGKNKFVAHIPYNEKNTVMLTNSKILEDILDVFGVDYGS
jgi:hypothetical protein